MFDNIDDFVGTPSNINDDDIRAAAGTLGVDPAVVAAVIDVETAGSGFLDSGRPKILFEAHVFGALTGFRYGNVTDPNGKPISSTYWNRTLYGASGEWQYTRLLTALKCDKDAALESCSWGAFQILAENYHTCGFGSVEDFVASQMTSSGQLQTFVKFIIADHLTDELRNKEWADFARQYNGPSYSQNHYDIKLSQNYQQELSHWTDETDNANGTNDYDPAEDNKILGERTKVRNCQIILNLKGFANPKLVTDGWFGPKTAEAVKSFEHSVGLPENGILTEDIAERLANLN